MTGEQARFDRALDLTLDATADGKVTKRKDPLQVRIAIEARALPYVQKRDHCFPDLRGADSISVSK